MSLISIIIPTYNTSLKRLEKTLYSVLVQTYSKLDILLIDDGSKQPFSCINRKISDPRINWIELPDNNGAATARNKGIENAKGEFVAFLDAGDWWAVDKIEKQLKLYNQNPNLVFVYNDIIKIMPGGYTLLIKAKHKGPIYRELLVDQPVKGSCSSVLTRLDILQQVGGFYDREDLPEDRELWLRLSKIGEVDFVPEPLTFLESPRITNRSADPSKKKHTIKRLIYKYQDDLKKYGLWNKAWANYHKSLANKYFFYRKFRSGAFCLTRAFIKAPSIEILKEFPVGFLSSYFPEIYIKKRQIRNNMQVLIDKNKIIHHQKH